MVPCVTSQTFNAKTEQWVKRDTDTGRFFEMSLTLTLQNIILDSVTLLLYLSGILHNCIRDHGVLS